ncbi:MAG: hypothetical protein H8E61_00795 [Bacteroidetes bacterium]|nr:hypothetical protein [Bacteroidota bacterium]
MCKVINLNGEVVKQTMTVEEAEALIGAGLMVDELNSTKDLCSDDDQIVEACEVLLANRKVH